MKYALLPGSTAATNVAVVLQSYKRILSGLFCAVLCTIIMVTGHVSLGHLSPPSLFATPVKSPRSIGLESMKDVAMTKHEKS